MPLTKCRECGKEYSDTVSTCPHCGYTRKNDMYPNKLSQEIFKNRIRQNNLLNNITSIIVIICVVLPVLFLFIIFLLANGAN